MSHCLLNKRSHSRVRAHITAFRQEAQSGRPTLHGRVTRRRRHRGRTRGPTSSPRWTYSSQGGLRWPSSSRPHTGVRLLARGLLWSRFVFSTLTASESKTDGNVIISETVPLPKLPALGRGRRLAPWFVCRFLRLLVRDRSALSVPAGALATQTLGWADGPSADNPETECHEGDSAPSRSGPWQVAPPGWGGQALAHAGR